MDPLTHTLVGTTLARTRLGRATPLAGAALVIGANLPDIDAFSYFAGSDTAFGLRRGWTHGPPALVLLPIVAALLLVAFDRRRSAKTGVAPQASPRLLLGLTMLGCATHPLLDWLNTYGVRLLMPFSDRWFYGDAVFIVDPWIWLLLGGASFIARRRGRIPWGWILLALSTSLLILTAGPRVPLTARWIWFAGIGAIALADRRIDSSRRGSLVATASLAAASAYIAFMLVGSASAGRWARAELDRRGVAGIERLMLSPTPAVPLRWRFVVETEGAYRFGSIVGFGDRQLELSEESTEKPSRSPVVEAALAAPGIQGTLRWMRFPFVEVEESPEGYRVHILDARYVRRRTAGFGGTTVRLDHELVPLD